MHKRGQNGKGGPKVVDYLFQKSSPKPDSWYCSKVQSTHTRTYISHDRFIGEKEKKRKKKTIGLRPSPPKFLEHLLCTNQKRGRKNKQKKSLMNFFLFFFLKK